MLQDRREHAPETLWKAQELYCVDRLSFAKVAEIVGVAASTLKRWSEKYDWQAKRAEIAQLESEIRLNKVRARSKLLKQLLEAPRPDTTFAVAALETLTLKEAEASRMAKEREVQQQALDTAVVKVNTKQQAIELLKQAVENKLAVLLSRPQNVDLKSVQEIQKCLSLISEMENALPPEYSENDSPKNGLSEEMYHKLLDVFSGKVDV